MKTGLQLRNGLWIIAIVVGLFLLSKGYWNPQYQSWRCGLISEALTQDYGLVIRYGAPSEFYVPPLPPQTNDSEEGFFIGKADIRYVQTALNGVKTALNKYPKGLIQNHLKAVFITGPIKIHGVQGAATYLNSWIYISAQAKYESFGTAQYVLSLHHELSSLLIESGPFPREQWQSINDPDFKYLPTQKDVVHSAAQENRRDPKDEALWLRAGFVHDYGMSSLENDFNMFAELAMTDPAKLKQLGLQYPKIKAKTQILVEFYSSLAPEMATHFESAGLIERLAVK